MILKFHKVIEPVENRLKLFFEAMAYKLYKNMHKGAWENVDVEHMLTRLEDEVKELREAVSRGNNVEIMMEAADVANFAMIIADAATDKGERR